MNRKIVIVQTYIFDEREWDTFYNGEYRNDDELIESFKEVIEFGDVKPDVQHEYIINV